MIKKIKELFASVLCLLAALSSAEAYEPGLHKWMTKEGELVLVSGVTTDNAIERELNYTFYLSRSDENGFYQIPFIDSSDRSKRVFTITTAGVGETTLKDARILVRKQAWLLIANAKGDSVGGPLRTFTVSRFRLVEGRVGDPAFYFAPDRTFRFTGAAGASVEHALDEAANATK